MRFSIVIPVYNVEKYIWKCLDSVMNQTFQDFEVIIVNDETPDNSMAIVQKFVEQYPDKIRVFHQKNTRQGGARNNGAKQAKGEYILFVDSDDYVSPDMLDFTDKKLRETPCDILAFLYVFVNEAGKALGKGSHNGLRPGLYHPKQQKEVLRITQGPVCKAYRREFYLESNVQFPEKLLYEDTITRLFFAKAESILVCDAFLYYYVQSPNSSMRQKFSEKMLDILKMTDIILESFRREGLYEEFKDIMEDLSIAAILSILEIINRKEPDNTLQIPMIDYILKTFPDYRKNPYMTERTKAGIDCLSAHDFYRYHYQFVLVAKLKATLIRSPLIAKLNELRKK